MKGGSLHTANLEKGPMRHLHKFKGGGEKGFASILSGYIHTFSSIPSFSLLFTVSSLSYQTLRPY